MQKWTLSAALCLCMIQNVAAGRHPFTDVTASDWFNDSVQYVYEHGLMRRTTETTLEAA